MWSIIDTTKLDSYLTDDNQDFLLYQSVKKSVFPRYFYRNFPNENLKLLEDKRFIPQTVDFQFVGKLNSEQEELKRRIEDLYQNFGYINGIIKARPGYGKTVCSAYISSTLKKKTLIVLDNSKLLMQWEEAFLRFTTLKKEDIGLIKGTIFNPKTVTITMVQTLVSKVKNDFNDFYKKFIAEGFDLIIFDEVHKTSSAPKYAKSSLFFNTKNIIGLSATPFGDLKHLTFMNNIIGPVIFEAKDYDFVPEFHFVKYSSGLGPKYSKRLFRLKDYIKKTATYNSFVVESKKYLDVIHQLTKKESGKKIIIIVFTLKQVDLIHNYLLENGVKAVQLHSKCTQIDKQKDDVVVATYKMASHGFDYPELSCLILGSPIRGKISLIQTIGRILRRYNDKSRAVVYDLYDTDFKDIFLESKNAKINIVSDEFNAKVFG